MTLVRYPLPHWPEQLEEREVEFDASEAFEAMREKQEMQRFDDHVPLPEFALSGSFWGAMAMLASAIVTICVLGVLVHVLGR